MAGKKGVDKVSTGLTSLIDEFTSSIKELVNAGEETVIHLAVGGGRVISALVDATGSVTKIGIETAENVPEEALIYGNKNGPVLAWAALGSSNIKVLGVLVDRGADVNERDTTFSGTPLTIAAANGQHPEMLRELVRLGADVNVRVQGGATVLMVAIAHNDNMDILQELIDLGAPVDAKNSTGDTAYVYANKAGKSKAANLIKNLMNK